MNAPDPAALFLPAFEAAGVEYLVTGGVAAIAYGEPRLTNDIDIVLRLPSRQAATLLRQFDPARFYLPPLETVLEEVRRDQHGHFNLIELDTMLRADIYLAGRDPLQAWGFDHRRRVSLGAVEGWVGSPEYVILQKLRFCQQGASDRHLRDIGWMLRVSEAQIDRPLLERKVADLGLASYWERALAAPLDD
ncbi:MAG: nucleotidyl transferase AbiEii/AbiGii toxin family protein [Gemmatimonadota bacterium]|nr:nucleotidyl transferase AbiEii/AbiGii toxin family protein [Gemmatimonadota bacterium]